MFQSAGSRGGGRRGSGGGRVIGEVINYAGLTEPAGWLFCYGQNISRATYADLFAVIGTTYGVGDGATTFGLPDLRGRVIAGQDDMGGSSANRLTGLAGGVDGDTLGGSGGTETHTLVTGELAAHTHETYHTSDSGSGVNSAIAVAVTAGNRSLANGSTGSGSAHNNVQPTFILNKMIYAGI